MHLNLLEKALNITCFQTNCHTGRFVPVRNGFRDANLDRNQSRNPISNNITLSEVKMKVMS